MDLELDLDVIKRLAEERKDENFKFRVFLKGQSIDEIDKVVHKLHEEIAAQIDCTKCANCCINLEIGVTDNEIDRLSGIDEVSRADFVKRYIGLSDDNTKYLKYTPCKYLKDKKCTIYACRPEECRSYPHTHKDGFIFRLYGVISNYGICPIAFNLYQRMKCIYGFD